MPTPVGKEREDPSDGKGGSRDKFRGKISEGSFKGEEIYDHIRERGITKGGHLVKTRNS